MDPYSEPLKQANAGWSHPSEKKQQIQNERKALIERNQQILNKRLKPK
jgi:hypothetical protein